jgi:hypothetical protein
MRIGTKVSVGMAVLAAAGTIGFAPASNDSSSQLASVEVRMTAVVMVSAETPQDQVWDMTYGAERPSMEQAPAQELVAEEAAIVDYTFG